MEFKELRGSWIGKDDSATVEKVKSIFDEW